MYVCMYVCHTKSPKVLDGFRYGFRSKIEKHPRSVIDRVIIFYGAAVLRQERVFEPGSRFSGVWLKMDVCTL